MDRVIVSNIPSSSKKDFGYRSINTSESHNQNQKEILDDVLNLYNKTNEIERVVKENADFIKLENTHLQSVNHSLTNGYKNLLIGYNEILNGEAIRKKLILPSNCKVDDQLFGAIVSDITSDITVRPSRKISKLAVFDSITDGMYIPDTLEVDIRCQTPGVITETDNDIYAPFYNDNELYWTRKVVTDNTCEEVKTEYVINLAEEIMTTADMNEIVIHPFLCNVISVYARYGDSNPWEKIYGVEHHPAINYGEEEIGEFSNAPRPFRLSFPNTKANQLKIVIKAKDYIEGETNLRNFMFGIKHIGAYINYYNPYDASHFNTEIHFDEKDSVLIEGFTFNFNNDIPECRYTTDIDYEFYYRDEYGSLQKIFEEFPFVSPSTDLLVKFRIGERYKDMNIRSIDLKYRALIEDYSILVSHMPNIRIDFKDVFNLYYTVKASDSNTLVEIVSHELTLDDGVTWIQMGTRFDGLRYVYEHPAFNEVCVKDKCMIRVTDFDGRVGVSNKFRISAEQFDKPPMIDNIDDIQVLVNDRFQLVYRAGDDYAITKHEFSDSNGNEWRTVEPFVEEEIVRGITYKKYTLDMMYDEVTEKECYIRLSDGVNDPVLSNLFHISVVPIQVTGLILDKYAIEIPRGSKYKLNHTIIPMDASDKTVIWETDNPQVATVDDYGMVTAVDKRRCDITVRTLDYKHRATCSVTVLVPVEEVLLNANAIVLYIGETFELIETVLPIDADNKRVTWSISNSSASIDKGIVTAKRAGTCIATVTTEDGSHQAHCAVEVRVPVSGIEINKKSIVKKVGQKEQLVAKVLPDNAFNKKIHWESSDSFIASVDSSGLVSANSPGKVIIKATTDQHSFSETCEVEVLVPVSAVVLNKEETRLPSDSTERLIATVMPEDAHDKSVVWTSSNNAVASVDSNGLVTPGRSTGNTLVRVTTNDGGFMDECSVTVYDRISGISTTPTGVLVPLTYNRKLTVSFENWNPYTTDLEEIEVENLNEDIFALSRVEPDTVFDTSTSSWKLNIMGLKIGKGRIKLSTTDKRIETYVDVDVEMPLQEIKFVNPDEITEGKDGAPDRAIYLVPVGFIRTVEYSTKPSGSKFHLGELDNGALEQEALYHTKYDVSTNGKVSMWIPETKENYQSMPYYRSLKVVNNHAKIDVLVQAITDGKIQGSMNWENHDIITEVRRGETFTLPFRLEPVVDESIKDQFKLREEGMSVGVTSSNLSEGFYNGKGAYGQTTPSLSVTNIRQVGDRRLNKFDAEYDFTIGADVEPGEYSIVLTMWVNSFNRSYDYKFAYKITVVE